MVSWAGDHGCVLRLGSDINSEWDSQEYSSFFGRRRGAEWKRIFVDSLFRTDRTTDRADASVRAEAGLILANSLRQPELYPRDKSYLTQLVTTKTGLNQTEAERRVSDVDAAERQAADDTRKAVAHSLYWLFVALLIGAFCASYAATIGGRQRDHVHVPV